MCGGPRCFLNSTSEIHRHSADKIYRTWYYLQNSSEIDRLQFYLNVFDERLEISKQTFFFNNNYIIRFILFYKLKTIGNFPLHSIILPY